MERFNIALDGPSGVGKSSLADILAEHYDMEHMDTGAMYRALALVLNQAGILAEEGQALEQALAGIDMKIEGPRVWVNGTELSDQIRSPEVSLLASRYSALPSVRKKLVALQQAAAARKGYIVDGRDICDVVLPDAEVKLFLTASAPARARRRWLQDTEKGKQVDYEEVLRSIEARDLADSSRAVSPLKISEQAVLVDSSDMDLQQTAQYVMDLIDSTLKKGNL